VATGVLETRGGTISDTERLPWLDLSREAPMGSRPRKGPPLAARRLIPLAIAVAALFVAGVGYISYRLGQDDGAATVTAREPASATVALPRRAPAPVEQAAPVASLPPARTVTEAPRRPVAKRPRQRVLTFDVPPSRYIDPPQSKPAADPATPPLLSAAPVIATAAPPPVIRPRPRAPGPIAPRGQLLNVGSYRSPAAADLAWAKMIQRYPYLAQLKRQVTPYYYNRANRTYWRLDLAAPTRSQSKKLCGYIKQVGYGCTVA
jgi:hypothetical protein